MPRTYVALDLETTGLSPDKDAIIEVGAVKFRDGEIVEEFATLVNPGRPIPPEITMLTGITDRDVVDRAAVRADRSARCCASSARRLWSATT